MAKKKKETRGRKTNDTKGKEVKKSYGTYLYPSEHEKIVEKYGSVTKAVEKEIIPKLPTQKK